MLTTSDLGHCLERNVGSASSMMFAPDHDPIRLNRIMISSSLLFEHDLFGKPVPTFPDHALAGQKLTQALDVGASAFTLATNLESADQMLRNMPASEGAESLSALVPIVLQNSAGLDCRA